MVKRAVKQVLKAEPAAVVAKPSVTRQQRIETRRAIKKGFAEVLMLLLERAAHGIVIEKVQALERLVDTLTNPKKKRR